ncbi:MAG: hypothetical protein IJ223_05670 [Clostridia bacterium]|nr:hypothetical protein [Clostridia bacterium]
MNHDEFMEMLEKYNNMSAKDLKNEIDSQRININTWEQIIENFPDERATQLINEIKIKYDPIKGIEELCKKAKDVLLQTQASSDEDKIKKSIEEIDKTGKKLNNCFEYVEEFYEKNEEIKELENKLSNIAKDSLKSLNFLYSLKTLGKNEEISSNEIMTKLNIDKEELEKIFKNRVEMGWEEESKGFRINSYGKLEIIDDSIVKNLIVNEIGKDNDLEEKIKTFDEASEYREILERKSELDYDYKSDEKSNVDFSNLSIQELKQMENDLDLEITKNEKQIKQEEERQAIIKRIEDKMKIKRAQEMRIVQLEENQRGK